MGNIYTIGHSNLSLPLFVHAVRHYAVNCVVDVRSRPQSSRFPHFSQPDFELGLRDAGIRYVFAGEELGGRPEDPKAYRTDGLVNYRLRRRSRGFQGGIEQVLKLAETSTLVLTCAEEDPLQCHRFLMICPELKAAGATLLHIRRNATVETQSQAEDRLLREVRFQDVASNSLFSADREGVLEDAYEAQAQKYAFRADPQTVEYI